MKKSAVPTEIQDLGWQTIMDLYPKRWVALEVLELSHVGVKKGRLIACGRNKERVNTKLREFLAANPQSQYAWFNTLPMKPRLDVILACR